MATKNSSRLLTTFKVVILVRINTNVIIKVKNGWKKKKKKKNLGIYEAVKQAQR